MVLNPKWTNLIKYNSMFGDTNPSKRPEVREKISLSKKGNKYGVGKRSEKAKRNISIGTKEGMAKSSKVPLRNCRHSFSREARKRLSEAAKGNNYAKGPRSIETRLRQSLSARKVKYHNHHIYLRSSDETLKVTRQQHHTIHYKIYEYILEKFGKGEIDSYLNWFRKKYGIRVAKNEGEK